jgi:hypothetical protein
LELKLKGFSERSENKASPSLSLSLHSLFSSFMVYEMKRLSNNDYNMQEEKVPSFYE